MTTPGQQLEQIIEQFDREHGLGGEMHSMDADACKQADDQLTKKVSDIASGWSKKEIDDQLTVQRNAQVDRARDSTIGEIHHGQAVIDGLEDARKHKN